MAANSAIDRAAMARAAGSANPATTMSRASFGIVWG